MRELPEDGRRMLQLKRVPNCAEVGEGDGVWTLETSLKLPHVIPASCFILLVHELLWRFPIMSGFPSLTKLGPC